jgi:ubiquinone/menaquinone biosynthesis C-methylase UbiE
MLQQYEQLVQSLERVVQPEGGLHPALRSQEGHEPPLKIILQNLYRYLMAVTANLDKLHEGVADARQAFLEKIKQVGACVSTLACMRPSFCLRCLLSLG